MPAYEAHSGTNVTEDPNWWAAQMSNPNPQVRARAQANLERIQQNRAFGEAVRQHDLNLMSHREAINARLQSHRDTIENMRQTHLENLASRQQRDREFAQARQDSLAQRQAEARNQQAYRTLAALPYIQTIYANDPKKAQAITQNLMNQFLSGSNIQIPGATPNPTTEALKNVAPKLGEKVAPGQPAAAGTQGAAPLTQPQIQQPQAQPQGVTAEAGPTFAPGEFAAQPQRQMVGYHWTKGSGGLMGGNDAGMQVYYDDGTSEFVNTSTPGQFPPTTGPNMADTFRQAAEQGRRTGQPYVEGGQVFNGPAGMDYNVSTGQWMPSSTPGYINGKPATQALVEGAAKSGVNPIYSPEAMKVIDQMRDTAAAGGGQPEQQNVAQAALSGTPLGQTATTPYSPTGGPPDFSPSSTVLPPAPATAPSTPSAAPATENAYNFLKVNPVDVAKNIGQGLLPSVFGFPAGTPGAPPTAGSPQAPTPPPLPPPVPIKPRKEEEET